MKQTPVHLGLVAVTANVVAAADSPSTSVLPNGNVQLLLILKTDKAANISRSDFSKLLDTELSLLDADENCLVNAKKLLQPDALEKPLPSAVK